MLKGPVATEKRNRLVARAIAFALATLSMSCGGTSPTRPTAPEPQGVAFSTAIQPIFDVHCVSCHAPGVFGFEQTGGRQSGGLDLTVGNSYASLVNQATFQAPEQDPQLRVAPANANDSYLLQKLESASPKEGERMPLFGPFLSQADVDRIRAWIVSGAPNN